MWSLYVRLEALIHQSGNMQSSLSSYESHVYTDVYRILLYDLIDFYVSYITLPLHYHLLLRPQQVNHPIHRQYNMQAQRTPCEHLLKRHRIHRGSAAISLARITSTYRGSLYWKEDILSLDGKFGGTLGSVEGSQRGMGLFHYHRTSMQPRPNRTSRDKNSVSIP